mgnify:CR=1 FL=1
MEEVEMLHATSVSDDIALGYLSMNSSEQHWSDESSYTIENDLLFQPFRVQ